MCNHSEAEQDVALVDGMCPLCMADELETLRARVKFLEESIVAARRELNSCQRNWDEDCFFNCNDILKIAVNICPSCTWKGNVKLENGICPQCDVNWHKPRAAALPE